MRVRLPHSNGLFLSRWGTPLTDLRASVPDGKRFCPGKFVLVSRIEGNLPRLGAKSIHFVGYLPARTATTACFAIDQRCAVHSRSVATFYCIRYFAVQLAIRFMRVSCNYFDVLQCGLHLNAPQWFSFVPSTL